MKRPAQYLLFGALWLFPAKAHPQTKYSSEEFRVLSATHREAGKEDPTADPSVGGRVFEITLILRKPDSLRIDSLIVGSGIIQIRNRVSTALRTSAGDTLRLAALEDFSQEPAPLSSALRRIISRSRAGLASGYILYWVAGKRFFCPVKEFVKKQSN